MIDSRHLVMAQDDDDPTTTLCTANIIDDNSYHTLEVDDTELAEYPTHLALVLKRPKVGKNGIVEPDNLEETYAFVDLKYFMPISANKYIMKSHVNLDEPGVAFTLPNFPMSSFMGETDPTSMSYCATNSSLGYYEAVPMQQQQLQSETVLLSSDVDGLQRSMVMTHQGGQFIHNGSQIQYQSAPTTCGQTIIQSYPIASPEHHQEQLQQPIYSQMSYSNEVYCGGGGPSSTSSSPPVHSCSHDQVVPSVGNADSPSPPAMQDQQQQHPMQEQARLILPCPMGCAEHTVHQQQQGQSQQQQQQQLHQQQFYSSSPPPGVQLQLRSQGIGKICSSTTTMPTTMSTTSTCVTENIISVSSASSTTKVIVEAAKTIPIEGQADLQHMHHQNHVTNLQEIKELDFSMF